MRTKQYFLRSIRSKVVFLAALLFFLVGCQVNQNQGAISSQTSNLATYTLVPPIVATLPSPSKTPIPTWTQTPSFADIPEVIQTQIEELMATNGGCAFPCWWGLTPGETRFDEVQQFIDSISFDSRILENDPRIYSAKIAVPEKKSSAGYLYFEMMREDLQTHTAMAIKINGYYFSMTEILNMLGEPSEVYYAGPLMFPINDVTFDLRLFYPNIGTVVWFHSITNTPDPQNVIQICDLDNVDRVSQWSGFTFWDPEENLSFDEVMGLPLYFNPPPYEPIEKFSNLDTASFYLNFSQPNPDCMEINTQLYGSSTLK